MKIIVWLGNPWVQYTYTRHNLGFLFLDKFRHEYHFSVFSLESKFKADISTWNINWEKILLLKPQTYMNLSWESLHKIRDYYKLNISDFIIIYDDISMDFWKVRVRNKWSAGWHNGIKSIIAHFWNEFERIKVWVSYDSKYDVADWVLSKFSEEELIDIGNEVYNKIEKELLLLSHW